MYFCVKHCNFYLKLKKKNTLTRVRVPELFYMKRAVYGAREPGGRGGSLRRGSQATARAAMQGAHAI